MLFPTKSQIFAILFAGALVVLLFFVRTKPDIKGVEVGNNVVTEIEKAVEMIKGGEKPMEGILKLREIAEKNPENEDAQLYLGVFSIQSGQFDKAIERFKNVIILNPDNGYAYQLLGQSYELIGDTLKAIENYELFSIKTKDKEAKKEIEEHLRKLKL